MLRHYVDRHRRLWIIPTVSTPNENQEKTSAGTGAIQRDAQKAKLRKEIKAVREGHGTGGYCETETLHEKEKALYKILSAELDAAKEKYGYSPDPKFKHPEIRTLELELNGFSWKPTLVVKQD